MSRPETSSGDAIHGDALSARIEKAFGISALRPIQHEALSALLAGMDLILVLATGGGKSLVYQAPAALIRGNLTIVVSPLQSLMTDQVDRARRAGLSAAHLNSTLGDSERAEVQSALLAGTLQMLFVSPERLLSPGFIALLSKSAKAPSLFAIDEAHCCVSWGHDFRPEYLRLPEVMDLFPGALRAAFTGSATPRARQEIEARLGLRDPARITGSFVRPNLSISVVHAPQNAEAIRDIIDRHHRDEAGIVFCATRAETESLARYLNDHGLLADHYHAGLEAAARAEVQDTFMRSGKGTICATIAFGMGVDKANVRYVIHSAPPENIEAYYQEIGRAGRDGAPSRAYLLAEGRRLSDALRAIRSDLENGVGATTPDRLVERRRQICQVMDFLASDRCRMSRLVATFGETAGPCGKCDRCLDRRMRVDERDACTVILKAVRESGRASVRGLVNLVLGRINSDTIADPTFSGRSPHHGALAGRDAADVSNIIGKLVADGLLVRREEQPSLLQISAEGGRFLQNDAPFEVIATARVAQPIQTGLPEWIQAIADTIFSIIGPDAPVAAVQALLEQRPNDRAGVLKALGNDGTDLSDDDVDRIAACFRAPAAPRSSFKVGGLGKRPRNLEKISETS